MMHASAIFCVLLAGLSASASAQENTDLDALTTADRAQTAPEHASDWHLLIEGAFGDTTQRYGLPSYRSARVSVDATLDKTLAPGWRLIFGDRLDWNRESQDPTEYKVNTVKELYLSWQFAPSEIVDVGRINTRFGVATGYNPTDYFRDGAVRSVVSLNPSSLRNNRLGSVMLRTQTLWDGGSLTAIASPKLTDAPSNAPFSADLGATNNADRWLLALSQRLTDTVNPQFLLYGEAGKSPQFGLDLTRLFGDATVAFVEWSGGQGASLYSEALGGPPRDVFRNRLASGLTYTTNDKITLTLEAEYNGAALDGSGWNALGKGAIPAYEQYRNVAQQVQDLPTRKALFLYGSWQDAILNHLDLSGFARQDLTDQSRLTWLEARYHWDHTDVALQWQRYGGKAWSDFGAAEARTAWQTVVTYFF